MRKQWSCSKCGFACSSTWRNLNPAKPTILCNACRSINLNPNSPQKSEINYFPLMGSPSSSIAHENVGFSVSQIGMIFGNLTFEPTLAIPAVIIGVGGKSVEPPRVKSEVVTADDELQHHFYSTTSTTIQIKQEPHDDNEQTAVIKADNEAIWDTSKVQKKKRSKLPQYTLSPLARFINQLQHASCYRRRRRRLRAKSAAVGGNDDVVRPKYDDVLIYEKCLYIAENEIGLGAELLSPPVYCDSRKTTSSVMIKEESSSTNESSAYSSGLIDA